VKNSDFEVKKVFLGVFEAKNGFFGWENGILRRKIGVSGVFEVKNGVFVLATCKNLSF
jgi:hypothetical protein